jgi:hypothetical protein
MLRSPRTKKSQLEKPRLEEGLEVLHPFKDPEPQEVEKVRKKMSMKTRF